MAFKFFFFLATLATARAGLLASPAVAYSAAPAVSSVYSSVAAPSWNTLAAPAWNSPVLTKTIAAPAVSYAPGPVVAKAAIAAPAWGSYAAPAISTYAAAPAIGNVYSSPLLTKTVGVAPAWGGYASPALSYAAPHAVGSSQQSTIRSLDGNSAVSTYSKAVDTAYSSVRKYDTRITNDAKLGVVSPVLSSYAAPALASYASPVASYASPIASYASPIASYASPLVTKTIAPAVSYSPASVVSHVSYNSGLGVNYGW